MLGLNELGYPYDSIVKQYGKLVEEIHNAQPSAKIFLEQIFMFQRKSLLPLTFIIMIKLIS